ncbi:MAG: glycosyltransferase [Eubacterium sp.]|nr:glycosyltransferase [Eubacterium sp.]
MVLFWKWKSFLNEGIETAFQKERIEYEEFFYQLNDWEEDPVFCEMIEGKLKTGKYDKVFSVNYTPLISDICERMGIAYIFWVYDAPLHIRNLSSLRNNTCNRGYFFDRGQVELYAKEGIKVHHLPLAASPVVFEKAVRRAAPPHGISLLGKLYLNDYSYYTSVLSDYDKGFLEGIINSQLQVYGGFLINDLVSKDVMKRLNEQYQKASLGKAKVMLEEMRYLLTQEVTRRERYLILAMLSKKHEVNVYGNDSYPELDRVHYHGYADYISEMPKVFAESQINLNITLKSIRTGIPLRVFDVLACGGFCISNYQEELAEQFAIGEEIEVYGALEELFEKAHYYMEHPDVCAKIAANGKRAIETRHGFEEKIRHMFR